MGKHTTDHGRSKYGDAGTSGLYRVHLPADASDSARALHTKVSEKLNQMQAIQTDAVAMLTTAETVLNSEELLKKSLVKDRLDVLFDMKPGALSQKTLGTLLKVIVATRAGLQNEGQVKFKRLTAEEDEGKTGPASGHAYGATSMYRTEDVKKRGYLLKERHRAEIVTTRKVMKEPEFEEGTPQSEKDAFLNKMKAKLKDLYQQYDRDLEREQKWKTGKFVEHDKNVTVYAGRLKLDMFTFVQRINANEHALISRTLVHEATHRFAGTADHTYIQADGLARKNTASLETSAGITTELLLENADSYAFFAYAMWAAKRDNDNFGT